MDKLIKKKHMSALSRRIFFITALRRGYVTFEDLQMWSATCKRERGPEVFGWLVEFFARELKMPPEFLFKTKTLWLFFYFYDSETGFPTTSLIRCFNGDFEDSTLNEDIEAARASDDWESLHWCIFDNVSLYLAYAFTARGRDVPDKFISTAYLHYLEPYKPQIYEKFRTALKESTIYTIEQNIRKLIEEANAIPWGEADERNLAYVKTIFSKCSTTLGRRLHETWLDDQMRNDPCVYDTFMAQHYISQFEDNTKSYSYYRDMHSTWAAQLDVACAFDMATPLNTCSESGESGFRVNLIFRATFDERYEFWATLEKAGLITNDTMDSVFSHVPRDIVERALPILTRHQPLHGRIIERFMSNKRRRLRR